MHETRDRIVAAALRLFARHGYRGASIREIAREVGIAEDTLYRHFRDKRDLFMACVEPVIAQALEHTPAGPVPAAGPPAAPPAATTAEQVHTAVRWLVADRLAFLRRHRDVFNVLFAEASYQPELAALFISRVLSPHPQLLVAGTGHLPPPPTRWCSASA